MRDDELLHAVGRVAAEQAAQRERWESHAGGGAGEDAELVRRMFAPASPESLERVTARVTEMLRAGARAPGPVVVPFRARALRWVAFAGPAAAAAAIALVLLRPPPALPRYALDVGGGVRSDRGAAATAAGPITVTPGTELVLLARPESSAPGGVHAAAFAVGGGAPVALPAATEASEKGALRVTLEGRDLAKAAGPDHTVSVVLVVDRSAAADARALAAPDGATAEWSRFTVSVRVAEASR
jgi:hypothetical protein